MKKQKRIKHIGVLKPICGQNVKDYVQKGNSIREDCNLSEYKTRLDKTTRLCKKCEFQVLSSNHRRRKHLKKS